MKNSRLSVALVALLCVTVTANSMGRFKQFFQSSGFKRGFYKVCRTGNLGLTFGPGALGAYKTVQREKELEALPDASGVVCDFVQEQMKAVGLDNPDQKIKILTNQGYLSSFVSSSNRMMLGVSDGQRDELTALLQEREKILLDQNNTSLFSALWQNGNKERLQSIEQALDMYRYVIQHESNHIKNQDVPQMAIMRCLIAPCLTHWGFKGLRKVAQMSKLIGPKNLNPGALKSLSEIPAGLSKLGVVLGLNITHARHVEQRADDQVVDTKEILMGGVRSMQQGKSSMLAQTVIPSDFSPEQQALFEMVFEAVIDPLHPTPTHRIIRFEERIAHLTEKKD
ncbi:MAG: hypothetical protein P4L31_06950 [Candidatus Babeliales bacterium]|nr:hypothetical protein [Candidatus Babeliales bacterium]